MIAHRGLSATHPENTASAFDAAVEARCDGIELDVQLSADGVPVLWHDRTLRRLGLPRRRVRDLDLAELARLDAGGWFHRRFRGERLLTLEEVLRRYALRTRLLVELKVRERDLDEGDHLPLADAVSAIVRRSRLSRRVMLLCFDPGTLARAAHGTPRLATVLNIRPPSRMGPSLRRSLEPLSAVSADQRALRPGFARECHAIGKPLFVYTCNTRASVRRALACGADAIMSDRADWLREHLAGGPATR